MMHPHLEQKGNYTYLDPRFVEPEMETDYLLFLNYSNNSGHYYGSGEPSSVKRGAGNAAELQSCLLERETPFMMQGRIENATQTIGVTLEMGSISNFADGLSFEEFRQQTEDAAEEAR